MTSSDLRVVLTLWNCGLTAREISQRTGISLSTVTTAVQSARARGEVVEERHRGEAGRLRDTVWSMFRSGMAPSEIDAELGTDDARGMVAILWAMGWDGPRPWHA